MYYDVQPLLQWKTINIIYSECVFVALDTQHAMPRRHFVVCGPSSFTTHYLINGTIFGRKKILEHKIMF
jgi:hypothetical protein